MEQPNHTGLIAAAERSGRYDPENYYKLSAFITTASEMAKATGAKYEV